MPPALDRLLASPSALRLLRSIVAAPCLSACHTTAQCCPARCNAPKNRTYAKKHGPPANLKWRRWSEQEAVVNERKNELESLRNGTAPAKAATRQVKPEPGFAFLSPPSDEQQHLVDGEDLEEDPDEYWATRLARHDRLEGLQGIWSIWHARRREDYCLPTENSARAQFLWGTFARHPKLVHFLIEHAVKLQSEKGETYPRIYHLIMAYWLIRKPTDASEYHHQMLLKLRPRRLPLRELAQSVRNYGDIAQEVLIDIYRNSNERDVYNEVVPRLIDCGNINMARRWHNLCTLRGDFPSDSFSAHPIIQLFIAESSTLSSPNPRLASPEHRNPNINQNLMRRLLGRDTAPVRFDDAFTARMFATRTVQTESIIKGLVMVGVNEIGPLAVSAMARRTQPITDLPRRFEDLRAAGIALQGSVFSLALEKFALEGSWDLVQSMLDSDQHPDVFGDVDTQHSLLRYYIEQEDIQQAQRTLAILTVFYNDPGSESWNLLLQLCVEKSKPKEILHILLKMRSLGVTLTRETMTSIRKVLVPRRRGHLPPTRKSFDDLRFVTRFYMIALEAGMVRVPPKAWYEIMRRFGMQGRLRELKRLILWLLSWYAPYQSTEFAALPRNLFLDDATKKMRRLHPSNQHYYNFPADVPQKADKNHPIRLLFPPSLQQGIIVWGFRTGILHNARLEQSRLSPVAAKLHHRRNLLRKGILKRLEWSFGLKMLVQLRDLNVHVHQHTVAKTLQAMFENLFGCGQSLKKANRRMEHSNTISYDHYVRAVNQIWGTPLFTEPHSFKDTRLGRMGWHPRFRRHRTRPTEVSMKQALGEEWAAEKDGAGVEETVVDVEENGTTVEEDIDAIKEDINTIEANITAIKENDTVIEANPTATQQNPEALHNPTNPIDDTKHAPSALDELTDAATAHANSKDR